MADITVPLALGAGGVDCNRLVSGGNALYRGIPMLYSNPYLKFMLEKCTKNKQPGITLGETIFLLQ